MHPHLACDHTHNHDNHGVRSERWRYIRYADGSEELYDMHRDPQELKNLAQDLSLGHIKQEHAAFLPEQSAGPAPGSRHRILTYEDGGSHLGRNRHSTRRSNPL